MVPDLSLQAGPAPRSDPKLQAAAVPGDVQDTATGFIKASQATLLQAASVLRKALHFCSVNAIF